MSPLRLAVVGLPLAVALLCGCPPPAPPSPPPPPPPGTGASGPGGTTDPAARPPATEPATEPGTAGTGAPGPGVQGEPIPVTVVPPPVPALGEPFRIKQGGLYRLGARRAQLGVVAVEEGPPAAGRLEVMIGPMAYGVLARKGAVIPIGQGQVVVDELDPKAAEVGLRWAKPMPQDPATWDLILAPRLREGGGLALREMSLTKLEDGTFVATGNVAPVGGRPVVTINVYAKGYPDDVDQGYDRHFEKGEGDRLQGKLKTFVLEKLEPGDPEAKKFGFVALRPGD